MSRAKAVSADRSSTIAATSTTSTANSGTNQIAVGGRKLPENARNATNTTNEIAMSTSAGPISRNGITARGNESLPISPAPAMEPLPELMLDDRNDHGTKADIANSG